MKWHASIGDRTSYKCCFCEYWMGNRPTPVPRSRGAFEYDTKDMGICRHSTWRGSEMPAGSSCPNFELYPHLH